MFTNSPLVVYTLLSPNYNPKTVSKITKITIHHMAGNLSIERCCELFANPARQGSSNYCIGTDGRIGMSVEEKNRAWTSSNRDNDNVAVTIEVANNSGEPNWTVSDAAYNSLIDLCVDICKRNGIPSLNYTGDANGNLTRHNMFAATACPGPYLQERFPQIAAEVNKRLSGGGSTPTPSPSNPSCVDTTSGKVKYFYNGLDYGYVFDPIWYVNSDPALREKFGLSSIKLFENFCNVGLENHQQGRAEFDVVAYMKYNKDLQKAFGVPDMNKPDKRWIKYYEHFITYGRFEGRRIV